MMKSSLVILFFIILGCESNPKELPILSYRVDDSGNKTNYSITYKNFTNQLNQPFTTDDIKDKVLIANFFFTKCPSICPPMRTELIDIAHTFKDEKDFLIVSHTIDPGNDYVEVLKNYSEATGIPYSKWQLVRSSVENTKQQADLFMTNFRPNEEETDFYHSSYVTLVDKKQNIRGFYNILVKEETERLKTDITRILH